MDKDLLYKYFECQTSSAEEQAVVSWVNDSSENKKLFEEERKLWALTCLREDLVQIDTEKKILSKQFNLYKRLVPLLKIACILLIGLFIGRLIFYNSGEKGERMQTVISPAGQQTEIILSDGSKVWLNSLSSITYPVSFNGKKRIINLDGEAYFEVSKKNGVPFIVQTGDYNIQVLGTTFNVLSRLKQGMFETSLFTGSVKIYTDVLKDSAIFLNPQEKVMLENGKMVKSRLTGQNQPAWKIGLFDFDNISFKQVMAELESFFAVRIFIDNEQLCDYKYTGKLRHKDGLEYLLQILSKDNPFEYNKDENGNYHLK